MTTLPTMADWRNITGLTPSTTRGLRPVTPLTAKNLTLSYFPSPESYASGDFTISLFLAAVLIDLVALYFICHSKSVVVECTVILHQFLQKCDETITDVLVNILQFKRFQGHEIVADNPALRNCQTFECF